jgi:hypothetical protein
VIDVFICSAAWQGDTTGGVPALRYRMCQLVKERWTFEPYTKVSYIRRDRLMDKTAFQRERRIIGEQRAHSHKSYYVLSDDDCYPMERRGICEAIKIADAHPQFAILSWMPDNEYVVHWTPEGYKTWVDEDVLEHVSVGGIRLVRRGILKGDWPPMNGTGYDNTQCDWIRSLGYRVGYFRKLTMLHLGKGWSTVWGKSAS